MVRIRNLLIIGAMALISCLFSTGLFAQIKPGERFPSLSGLEGSVPDTTGKVVFVDFWASWCGPCKASFPAYDKLQKDYAAKGLVILAVSVDEQPSAYEAFLSRLKPSFSVVRDANHALVQQVRVPTMPTSYVVDRNGIVRFINPAFHGERTEKEVRRQIESLLALPPS